MYRHLLGTKESLNYIGNTIINVITFTFLNERRDYFTLDSQELLLSNSFERNKKKI